MDTITKQSNRRHRGTTVVEAAFVLPVLLMLTLGAIEYGWLFLNAHWITNAARQGARIAIVDGERLVMEAQARAVVTQMLADAHLDDDHPIVSVMPEPIPGDPAGRLAEAVYIIVPTADLLIINAPLLFPTPATLRAKVTMAREGSL